MRRDIHLINLIAATHAQQVAWGQWGGEEYIGATDCVSGCYCPYVNDWYPQCILGSGSSTLPTTGASSSTASSTTAQTGSLKWIGANEAGAEWGMAHPVDYYFPSYAAMGTLIGEGYNIFRLPFSMENMAVGSLTATLNLAYLAPYVDRINYITSNGAWAVIAPHNFGRYNGAIITDMTGFEIFWANLATQFRTDSKVIFDINNEFHTMDQTLVFELNQAGIDGIRGVGATTQYIFAEGNSWTSAWIWNTTNDSLKDLADPSDLLVYEMHQYLDSDGSGLGSDCVSTTIGVDRVEGATAWLRRNGKLGVLGEFAGGPSSVCEAAVTGLLDHLQDNSDVWLGALWWSAGVDWPAGIYWDFEPPSGISYQYYDSILKAYAP